MLMILLILVNSSVEITWIVDFDDFPSSLKSPLKAFNPQHDFNI